MWGCGGRTHWAAPVWGCRAKRALKGRDCGEEAEERTDVVGTLRAPTAGTPASRITATRTEVPNQLHRRTDIVIATASRVRVLRPEPPNRRLEHQPPGPRRD